VPGTHQGVKKDWQIRCAPLPTSYSDSLEGIISFLRLLFKIFGAAWAAAFSLYFILLIFWSMRGNPIPIEYKEFCSYFEIFLNFLLESSVVGLAMGAIILWAVFKQENDFKIESGWGHLAEKYLLRRAKLKEMKLDFQSGEALIGKSAHYGIHVAGNQYGFILKFPFPYSLAQPTLLIPWTEVSNIALRKHPYTEKRKSIIHLFRELFGSHKYAEINLKSFPKQKLIITWKKGMKELQHKNLKYEIENYENL
jgi:hypothetical protein